MVFSTIEIAPNATLTGEGTLVWNINGNSAPQILNSGTLAGTFYIATNFTGSQTQNHYFLIPQGGTVTAQFALDPALVHYNLDVLTNPDAVAIVLKGDMNGDGLFNDFDITPFTLALTDVNAYLGQYGSMAPYYQAAGDMNSDGSFNDFDITPFVNALTG